MLLKSLFKRKIRENTEKSLFWDNENQLNQLCLIEAVKRVEKKNKNDLIFDPVGLDEWVYLSSKGRAKLRKLLFEKYTPKHQITLSMPKGNYTFRPVSYLLPSDSIIYQAIVDKLIMYKKDKFSNQVYSNRINDVKDNEVFSQPVLYWLKMMNNIREQYKRGNNYYFFSDISGYYENIKIDLLLALIGFYAGRKEREFEPLLKKLLVKWQFAETQGLVQPHNASAILSKIYLIPIDSALAQLKGKYSRYVDEFHIIVYSKKLLLSSILNLNETLRQLGLNLNASKSKYIEGAGILDVTDKDRTFFNLVNYLESYLEDFELAQVEIDKKFDEFVGDFDAGKNVNMKIFRYCIRRYGKKENQRAVKFCLKMLRGDYSNTVDIVKYLSVFMKNEYLSKTILKEINKHIDSSDIDCYQWVKCWLLNLFIKTDYEDHVDTELLKKIIMDKNHDDLSRATALLAYAKHSDDCNLIFLTGFYHDTDSILLRRAILAAASKMPRTLANELYSIKDSDELDIIVLKEYLLGNDYTIQARI